MRYDSFLTHNERKLEEGRMPAVFEHQRVVVESEIDPQRHVNNVVFLDWMQDAALAHSAAQGWPPERYRETGAGWVARRHEIEYLKPAFLGDEVLVRTWVSGFRKVTSTRRYEVFRCEADGEVLIARAETTWAFIDLETLRPKRIPPSVGNAFTIVPESSGEG